MSERAEPKLKIDMIEYCMCGMKQGKPCMICDNTYEIPKAIIVRIISDFCESDELKVSIENKRLYDSVMDVVNTAKKKYFSKDKIKKEKPSEPLHKYISRRRREERKKKKYLEGLHE